VLKIYDEKNTQKTSYIKRPVSKRVDTFKLGSRTNAINATQSPIPIAKKINHHLIKHRIILIKMLRQKKVT